MREFGFWVYTDPLAGGCCAYQSDDWLRLLDDMADGGMNSLVICIRGKRTGYRSRLPFLDQPDGCPAIESDNRILHDVIEQAHDRDIRVHFQNSVNIGQVAEFGVSLPQGVTTPSHGCFKFDLDSPGIEERAVAMTRELIELFPNADGLSLETEGGYIFYPHRKQRYDEWALKHNEQAWDELCAKPPDPRVYPYESWRRYATYRTCQLIELLMAEAKSAGFNGTFSHMFESYKQPGTHQIAYDMQQYAATFDSELLTFSYDYFRWQHPGATPEYLMAYPKSLGLKTSYLGRGVMTWVSGAGMPITLQQSWAMDFQDAITHDLDGIWMFEADTSRDGDHGCLSELQQLGFTDGVDARKQLLAVARSVGIPQWAKTVAGAKSVLPATDISFAETSVND